MYTIIKNNKLKKILVVKGKDRRAGMDSWYVTGEKSLREVPGAILTILYNRANSNKEITKFSDNETAARRVIVLLDDLSDAPVASLIPDKPIKKGRGVIQAFHEACLRPQGGTIIEIVQILAVKFPNRKPSSMENTVRINLNKNYIDKRGYTMTVEKEPARKGKVYRLTPKQGKLI